MSRILTCDECGATTDANEFLGLFTSWFELSVGDAFPALHFCSKGCLIGGVLKLTRPKEGS